MNKPYLVRASCSAEATKVLKEDMHLKKRLAIHAHSGLVENKD